MVCVGAFLGMKEFAYLSELGFLGLLDFRIFFVGDGGCLNLDFLD